MTSAQPHAMRALTREIADTTSPVRQFLDERFTRGLREVQRRFRGSAPPLTVPSAPKGEANPGTIGGAADWLLRFLVCPHPDVNLAMAGAARSFGPRMMRAVADLSRLLMASADPYVGPIAVPDPYDTAAVMEMSMSAASGSPAAGARQRTFTGPAGGADLDPELLARGCWALALLTEAFRSLQAATMGPLARFRGVAVTADELLSLAPAAGLDQIARFRRVFETALIPHLASRSGEWVLGPTFSGSALVGGADGDLIAAGLLLDLKTSIKLSLPVTDLLQVIGYALLDFDDEYKLDSLGIFSARYRHLCTWELAALLEELAGDPVSLPAARGEFRQILNACQPIAGTGVGRAATRGA